MKLYETLPEQPIFDDQNSLKFSCGEKQIYADEETHSRSANMLNNEMKMNQ